MRTLAVPAVLAVVLAGCSGGEGAPAGGDVRGPGETLPDAATILGLVVDDSQAPLAQAQVALADTDRATMTDEGGAFRFDNLAPGDYILHAGRLGYEAAAKKVSLGPNDELTVTLVMTALAIATPYQDTFGPFNGHFECQFGTPAIITPCTGDTLHRQDLNSVVFPGDVRRLTYNLSSDEWQTMIGEARWSKTTVATSQGMAVYPSYSKRDNSHWWCEADGPSPIQFRLEREADSVCTSQGVTDPKPSMEVNPLVLVADPGFGGTTTENPPVRLMLQQRFELMMTVFYHEPAPAEYTGFGDV